MKAPELITPQVLLAKLRAGTSEVYEISCRELVVPVRVLSVDEFNAIRRDAMAHKAKMMGDDVDMNLHIEKVTLKMASTVSKGAGPLLTDAFLKELSIDEINYLYNEYVRVMDIVNPSVEQVTPDQFNGLVEALKKNTITSSDLSLRQLRAICTAYQDMIQRQGTHASHKASSSGGVQSE